MAGVDKEHRSHEMGMHTEQLAGRTQQVFFSAEEDENFTYPGAFDPGTEFDYFEFKTGASYTFAKQLTVGVTNYWSPENTGETGNNDVLELSGEYAFGGKLFNFFSPSISGLVGWQWGEASKGGFDYTYWNVGLSLGFMENWSADIRYWDTDISGCTSGVLSCDERVVGTLSASF